MKAAAVSAASSDVTTSTSTKESLSTLTPTYSVTADVEPQPSKGGGSCNCDSCSLNSYTSGPEVLCAQVSCADRNHLEKRRTTGGPGLFKHLIYRPGDEVLARWKDCKKYPAKISRLVEESAFIDSEI
ncbi:hypothetical protein RRG08_056569 [Elysia crispata]|uniref:Uncharacterized protein n=1 Tax=Elysia crispata TaxID=231223 RepID=A0AAE1E280_9GAST|nr:hypothetical protein RRG08_056569 [Elysia crispata]